MLPPKVSDSYRLVIIERYWCEWEYNAEVPIKFALHKFSNKKTQKLKNNLNEKLIN